MAMNNNTNYGFPPSGYSSPYSSTPTAIRSQRPRFGFSGPAFYPRPRSSASKPNPDSFSDSMINNYGSPSSRMDSTYNSENYDDSFQQSSGSNYYSCNESLHSDHSRTDNSLIRENTGMMRENTSLMRENTTPIRENIGSRSESNFMGGNKNFSRVNFMPGNNSYGKNNYGNNSFGNSNNYMQTNKPQPNNTMQNNKPMSYGEPKNTGSGILPNPASQFGPPKYFYNNSSYGMNSLADLKGNYQKQLFGAANTNDYKPQFASRKFGKAKRRMASKSNLRCDLCSLDFTSQIPYDMHLRGARHAKKLKAKETLEQAQSKGATLGESTLFCELCNVKANSILQYQTHLDGNKHKNKLNPKEPKENEKPKEESKEETKPEDKTEETNTAEVNGKTTTTNGAVVRSLPADFEEPPKPAKLTKYSCDICNVSVNSETQLQQHLSSKKHQNKLEGKPVTKERKKKKVEGETTEIEAGEKAKESEVSKVVGVKTLESSFVQGGTLQ